MRRMGRTSSGLAGLLTVLVALSLHIGAPGLSVWRGLWEMLHHKAGLDGLIIGQLRLPRTILAVLVGGTLGLSGLNLQTILRNPLADPTLLGISGFASLGAVAVFYTGLMHVWPLSLPLAALLGAVVCATIILFALSQGHILSLVLSGAALGILSMALLSLLLNLMPSPYARYEIMHWLMGSLGQAGLKELMIAAPGLCLGAGLLFVNGKALNSLVLGEDVAQSLGFSPQRIQRRIVLGTALAVGSGVAVTGAVGFVGLVVPHLTRALVGARPSDGILPAALLGGCVLLGADMLVRLPFQGAELQLGVVTALLGTPFFLWQIWHLLGTDS